MREFKAVLAVEAQILRATERGVRFLARHEVLDVVHGEGKVSAVVTDQGEIPADIVVCCAGIWGPKIARMVGMNLPLTPLAHQLAWTGPVPALEGQAEEAVRPILRHQDGDLYYRDRCGRGTVAGHEDTRLALADGARRYGKPVLLLHGDSHFHLEDRPVPGAQNLLRVMVPGAHDLRAVQVTVDAAAAEPFRFALIGAADRPARPHCD